MVMFVVKENHLKVSKAALYLGISANTLRKYTDEGRSGQRGFPAVTGSATKQGLMPSPLVCRMRSKRLLLGKERTVMGVRSYRGRIVCDKHWPDKTRTIRVCRNRTESKQLLIRIEAAIVDRTWPEGSAFATGGT